VAIDKRAFEALLPDPAIQFIGRLLGGRDRQRGKGRKARWIFLHHVREEIDKFFWPILECAEALNVPIYLHPTVPPKPVADALYGGFSPTVSAVFADRSTLGR
jgi:predicted TIM-barrel fold metal-dependent hydrolase